MQKRWNKPGSLFTQARPAVSRPVKKTPLQRLGGVVRFFFGGIRKICTLLGAMILFSALMLGLAVSQKEDEGYTLPDRMVLSLRLNEGLFDVPPEVSLFSGLGAFAPSPLTVREIVETLDRAATDPAVKGLVFSIEGGQFSLSQTQEIRAALKRFRASGKPTYAYSPSYAEAGAGMGAYYLAAGFEHIWMQPVGAVALAGFDANMPFARKALEKIGVTPQFFQRKEYKSVMENFSRDGISPESREMTASLLADITMVMMADISADRGISRDDLYDVIDRGVFTDSEAVTAKLVDHLGYSDVLSAHIRSTLGNGPDDEDLKILPMRRYANTSTHGDIPLKTDKRPHVGVIYASGNIIADSAQSGFSTNIAAADRLVSTFNRAIRDDKIKAIVFRIDSPGGSPTASESIRRVVVRAQEKGKPVIVSMGTMAGSGGYWIATDADRIFALPATLTGSIGVASGKFDATGLMEKIGVTWEGVKLGQNADIWSLTTPFSESGEERMNAMMDNIYAAFTDRVAKGRKLPPEKVEEIARGRVWTGNQAKDLGLVDELGGLDVALDYAATKTGGKTRADIRIVDLPRPNTPFNRLLELMNMDVLMGRVSSVFMKALGQEARQAGVPSATLSVPFKP